MSLCKVSTCRHPAGSSGYCGPCEDGERGNYTLYDIMAEMKDRGLVTRGEDGLEFHPENATPPEN